MRSAEVFHNGFLAGILTEKDEGVYIFRYDKDYAEKFPGQFLTFTMPLEGWEKSCWLGFSFLRSV
jgi:serine/threonine-protein kinase HipA